MSWFRRKKTPLPPTKAQLLYEHLYRMGAAGATDPEGVEYMVSFDMFWYPMILIAEEHGTLKEVMEGIRLVYEEKTKEDPDFTTSWDSPVNDALRYDCFAKLLEQEK